MGSDEGTGRGFRTLMIRLLGVAALATSLVLAQGAQVEAAPYTWYERGTPMAPRLEWNANDGYCGEMSFISAGMLFGQYTSQWTARSLIAGDLPQWNPKAQLLLGVNDLRAARAMKLDAVRFDNARQRSTDEFLVWVKKRFLRGNAVIIGVLNNTTQLDEPGPGDAEYDHIVPVFGIGSQKPLNSSPNRFRPTDAITISDNGLHSVGPNYPYLYAYPFATFPRSRSAANDAAGPLYSLRDRPRSYGTAVTGIADPDGVTIPVRLTSDLNGEGAQDQPKLTSPPPPKPMTLTAHVRIPDQSRAYRVYLYDDFTAVPVRDFNARAGKAIQSWVIPAGSGASWTVTVASTTDRTRVFRAVPASAP